MKDEKGSYYYPFPDNKKVRMYVRETEGTFWFRLWNGDDPDLWEQHGWVPYEAIKRARSMYKGNQFDPNRAYDIELAERLIRDARLSDPS